MRHDPVAFFDDGFFADPYRAYAALHTEGPVHRIRMPNEAPVWLVTGFEAAREALRDPHLSRRYEHASEGLTNQVLPEPLHSGNLLTEDPPDQTRLRKFVNFAFTPQRVERLRPTIQSLIDQHLDAIESDGEADLMNALAVPLPVTVIAELLGIPIEERRRFRRWADVMFGDDQRAIDEAGAELLIFSAELIRMKRLRPGDDLISHWLTAADRDGDKLTGNQLLGMIFVHILGGFDTTAGVIGNAMAALLARPEQAEALRTHPERIPSALDELLRYDGSVHTSVRRFATRDMTIGGVDIAAGDAVIVDLAAANQDPGQFNEPRSLDLSRDEGRNLAFGFGPHYCPGEGLARLEATLAIESLLRRFPDLAPAEPIEHLTWRRSRVVRVLKRLPVVF